MPSIIRVYLRSSAVPILLCAFFVTSCLRVSTTFAQAAPDPEIERKSFDVAEGFEVTLWAADPMLANPVQMNFDPAGRLWIATSEIYPQLKPGQVADDKILVLEDTKGAGKADKVTVFARGLLIPTGVLPGDGGAYVANSTEILHMKDTDGDGKADPAANRVMLSGFGTEDTHHIIHSFRWGQDGIFYFNQSVYIHSYVETPWGPRKLRAGGTWAYRPETQQLEIFTRGLINHWGHAWDKYANSFMTDGAGGDGVNYAFPGVCFVSLNDPSPRIIRGLNPGSPKYAGAEVISSRHFPDDWQGDLITNDFRANRVVRYKLSDAGAGFSSKLMPDVIKTRDKAFRPVDVKMGPDGALYIADWFNPIINHGEVDFRDPRRDKTHGRIWRLTAKGRPLVDRPKISGQPIEALLEHLKSPEDYTRRQARLELRERDRKAVHEALDHWTAGLGEADDAAVDFHRLQALWTYQTINTPSATLINRLLKSSDAGVRAATERVVGDWANRFIPPAGAPPAPGAAAESPMPVALQYAARGITDANPRVRLEAVRALAHIKDPRAVELALSTLDKPMDQFLDFALYLTVSDLADVWLPAFQSGKLTFGGDTKKIEFALKAIRNPAAIKPLVDDFKAGKIAAASRKDVAELIAALGTADDLAMLFAATQDVREPATTAILTALDRAARTRNIKPKIDPQQLRFLFNLVVDDISPRAIRLAGAWKIAALREDLIGVIEKPISNDPPDARTTSVNNNNRKAALESLADLGDVQTLTKYAKSAPTVAARAQATAALASIDSKTAAPLAAALLAADTTGTDLSPLLSAFVNRKDGPATLGAALKSTKPTADNAKLALRALYALGHAQPAIVQPLQAAAGIDNQPKQRTPEQMTALVAEIQTKGDPARGEAIFRRNDTACLRCHAIGGAGGQLGPDLSSLGSAPVDYLVESILLPAKAVKEGYHSIIVETTDGDQLSGVKVRQTEKELILRDAVQDEIVIPLNTIKGKPREGQSMMPAGLADPLTHQELVDLVRFLSEMGRPGPYALGVAQVARRWEILEKPALDAILPGGFEKLPQALPQITPPWSPAYAKVSGVLPGQPTPLLARAQVSVSTGGKLRLLIPEKTALGLWINGQLLPAPATEIELDLPAGQHTLTFLVKADANLRAELVEAPGSPARAQFVTGR